MQIILLEDVKALGKKGQIVEVSDGYANNFILPKKKGLEATPKNLNQLKHQKLHEAKLVAENLADAKALGENLESKTINLTAKVGTEGRLFGAISSREIVQAAKEQCGLELDKKKVILPEPIKTLGTHLVPVKLHKDVTANLKVIVTQE